MAVYTALDDVALGAWLTRHDVGRLVERRDITSGIENSNFFVTTADDEGLHRYVLTLFERLGPDELPFYLSLMQHLARHGVPCPAPVADRDGALCSQLAGKPAALVTRLAGRAELSPTPAHCAAIGATLARLHLAGRDFTIAQDNPRGLAWWEATAPRVRGFLTADQRTLLDDEMALQSRAWQATTAPLPRGPIHADLFRDNALFERGPDGTPQLRGIIDFYFAGCDAWLLDLAVCANDWCVDLGDASFDDARLAALTNAYVAVRALDAAERAAWTLVLRAAALRFWLSRLDDLHRPRPAQLLVPHDPDHFERVLRRRRAEALRDARTSDFTTT